MRVIVCENYEEMSCKAAKLVASQITLKPDSVLGFATGSTPLGLYQNLIKLNQSHEIDFAQITTFNLDEYYPISTKSDQSYRYFMNTNLFNHINIKPENTFVPNGEAADTDAECAQYEENIAKHDGIDMQILGIGQNGHIGFNEPDQSLVAPTHVTGLTENTIQANSRFFASSDQVPRKALTMGMKTILSSKKILILISGENKQAVLKELLAGGITTSNPATLLNLHNDVVLLCDKDAYGCQCCK